MTDRITEADVRRAEEALAAAKGAWFDKRPERGKALTATAERTKVDYRTARDETVRVRQAFRRQEETAGIRTSLVAGDAFVTGVDCPKCDLVSVPPDDLRTHLLIEHGGKKG